MKVLRTLVSAAAVALVAASVASAPARAQTELRLMGWASSEAENKALQGVVDGFMKANPEIKVNLSLVPDYDTTLAKDLSDTESAPDVFYVSAERFGDLAKSGQLAAIGDKLTNPDDFYPSLKSVFTYDGKFFCPPKDFSTLALQINTDMFEKAGLKAPTTWQEMADAAKALTTDTVAGIVLPPAFDRIGAFLYSNGGEITNADLTKMEINSPAALESFKFYSDLYLNGHGKTPADLGAGWPGEAFGKGLAAMSFEGNWIVGYLKEQFPDLKYESVELPKSPAGSVATLTFTVCYGTPSTSKNLDASIKLIDYLTGTEGSTTMYTAFPVMPARASLAEAFTTLYPELSAYVKGAEYARKWQFVPGWGAVQDEANKQIQRMFSGETTPEDALAEIEKAGNDVLTKAK
jgi:multiple sugar transport system substrate-binding protein